MNKNLYSLGLMSGTSLDGIDVSIIKSDGEQYLEIIDNLYLKYEDQLKLKLKKVIDSCTSKDQLAKIPKEIDELEKELTLCHINACKLITEKNKNILIAAHGNSIRAICKFLFQLDNKKIPKLEIPTGNPLFISLNKKNEITECYYLDKERAKDLIVF